MGYGHRVSILSMKANGPWQYRLSPLSEAPEVTAAVEYIAAEQQGEIAA